MNIVKISGICGILAVVAIVTAAIIAPFGGIQAPPEPTTAGAVEWLEDIDNSRLAALALGFGFIFYALILIYILGLWEYLKEANSPLIIAVPAAAGGLILLTVDAVIQLAMAYELASRYAEAGEAVKPVLAAFASTLAVIRQVAFSLGTVLLQGVGVSLLGLAILRTAKLPRWLGWLGIIGGLVGGWLGALEPLSPIFDVILGVGFAAFLGWILAGGILLLKRRSVPA